MDKQHARKELLIYVMQHVLAENYMKIYIIEQLAIMMIISNTVGPQLSNLDYPNPQLSESII